MGLVTQSAAPPYQWTLTNISGRQTIAVTVTDPSGKTSSSSVTVEAPALAGQGSEGGAPLSQTDGTDGGAGCNLAGCDLAGGDSSGARASALAGLAAVLLAARRRSPARARRNEDRRRRS
jgi:hypothetical protein